MLILWVYIHAAKSEKSQLAVQKILATLFMVVIFVITMPLADSAGNMWTRGEVAGMTEQAY